MPRITPTQIEELRIPTGGTWYTTQEEALEEISTSGGLLLEIPTSETNLDEKVYGVFSTQETFCRHAKTFLKSNLPARDPPPATTATVAAMLRTHTPIHRDECRSLHLPLDGKWFSTEMGGLTAFTLQAGAYMVKIYLLTQDMDHATSLNQDTSVPFYGIFKSKDIWNTHRRGLPRAYHEPPYPFTMSSTLEYDRCRCTLMGIKGALYTPPKTNELTLKEMEEFTSAKRINLPRADCSWTRTKEEALRLGGHVLEWTIDETTVYSVYGNFETCTWRLIHYMETLQEENPCIYKDLINRKINWKHVASCNMYGFLSEDWNSSDSLVSLAKALAKPEAE